MKKEVYLVVLYDYYESLLKEEDKNYFKDYYFSNLSLSEIAENNNVSRNAVHKRVKHVEEMLNDYEDKLGLYRKEQEILSVLDEDKKEVVKKILNS